MEMTPRLFVGKVMHKRLFPKVNAFTYGIYYLALPLNAMAKAVIAQNRPAALSFYNKDHGRRDGLDLDEWVKPILQSHGIDFSSGVMLIAMPRVLGYVFNPVSFWLCRDRENNLSAVLCEVNNTFGETHFYLCMHDDKRPILAGDWLTGEKFFHVSPFLVRTGHYRFRFDLRENSMGIWIDYLAEDGRKQLLTALTGTFLPMTRSSLRMVFWKYPLVTFKSIVLIHFQAIKLFFKGVQYVPKPDAHEQKISKTGLLKKFNEKDSSTKQL